MDPRLWAWCVAHLAAGLTEITMGAISSKLRNVAGGGLMFWCPGCDMAHEVRVGDGSGPRWGWNGDAARPTFTPSVLVTWSEPSDDPALAGDPAHDVSRVCH